MEPTSPPRTLGFSAIGLLWDYKEAQYEELHPTKDRSKNKASNVTRDKETMDQITTRLYHGHIRETDRKQFLMAWFELVYDYSGLRLTYQSDKLIALAGISHTIHMASGFDYFYGLWNDPAKPEFFLSQLLWHTLEPEDNPSAQQLQGRPPSFSWTSCNCVVDYPITLHDRIVNDDSRISMVTKPGWLLTDKGRYFQNLYRHSFHLFSGQKGGNPWDREIHFRTKVEAFLGPSSGSPIPTLLLQGPAKEVKIRLGPWEHGFLWEYPWDTLPIEDKKNDSQRMRWFFPDATTFASSLMLLTIAQWWRSWDQRWYVAGLALRHSTQRIAVEAGGKETTVPVMYRVGYFEHSWVTKHKHWYDGGEKQIVAII